jgi:membrane fusion protein, multidrug efflux system
LKHCLPLERFALPYRSIPPLAFVTLSVVGCNRQPPARPEPPPVPVMVAKATVKTVPIQARVIGNVRAVSTVSIRAQVGGQLNAVHFKEGDYVKKDQKLFTIDPMRYQAQVRQAKANLAKSKAILVGAEQILNRLMRLSKIAVSVEEIDTARAAEGSARATVAADEAAVHSAELQESYATIASPLDGRTGNLLVTAGNLVTANDPNPLVVVNQVSPIYVSFALPEQRLPAVAAARRERPLRVQAYLRDGEPPVEGVLAFIDNAVDATTGTVELKAEFKNEDRKLWPGQFVDVVLTIRDRPASVVVPEGAIQSGQRGAYVYVVTPEKTVENQAVTVAFETEREAVVASGLAGGETVVVEGQLRLAPQSRVEIKEADPQSKTPAAANAGRNP